jgi:uncharacterized protein YqkB
MWSRSLRNTRNTASDEAIGGADIGEFLYVNGAGCSCAVTGLFRSKNATNTDR